MEQAIGDCEAFDGHLAFTHKPPLKKIKQKKNVMVIRDQLVSRKSNYQERTYNLHLPEKNHNPSLESTTLSTFVFKING